MGSLAFALYLRTLAPGLLGGDSGEFQFAAWLGGFAHPTGYPLYLLLGYLWSHLLPLNDPAWRMNAFSALWAGVAVGLFYLLALRVLQITARRAGSAVVFRLPALLAAATFAVTPTFWSQAVVAEVYTLNAALAIATLLGLVTWAAQPPDQRSIRPLYAVAFLVGLGLAHHRTILLWLPAIAIFLWIDRRPPTADRRHPVTVSPCHRVTVSPRHLVTLSFLVAAPLLLYLYIPLIAARAPYRQVSVGPGILDLYDPTLAGFIDHVTGSEFGAEFRSPAGALAQVIPSLRLLASEVTWVGVALGLIGLGWLAWRSRVYRRSVEDTVAERCPEPVEGHAEASLRQAQGAQPAGGFAPCSRPLLALTGVGFLTLFIFNLVYGIGDIAAYYIPLYALWCLWIALGVAAIGEALAARGILRIDRRPPSPRHPVTPSPRHPVTLSPRHLVTLSPCLLALLLPAYLLLSGFAAADQSRNNQTQAAWNALLAEPIPSGAILVTNDRDEMMPFWYLRYVEGVRPDLTGLFPLIQPGPAWMDVVAAVESALWSGRPVLLIKGMPGLEIKFRMQEAGQLVRVLAAAVDQPPARPSDARFGDAGAEGAVRLLGYDIQPVMLAPGQPVTITLHWQPAHPLARDYMAFVHLVNAEGRVVGASDHRPGGVYYPSSQWKVGEVLVDGHTFTAARDLGRPPYAVEVGLYTADGGLRHLGQPQRVGVVGRERPPDAIPADLARLDATFGDQIALAGYRSELQGDRLALALYWQALAAPAADYTVFVHVLDGDGKIVAQYDGRPLGGELPTRAWPPGYSVADAISIPIPSSLAPGVYRLAAGLYDAASGVRLPLRGSAAGDAVSLGEFTR